MQRNWWRKRNSFLSSSLNTTGPTGVAAWLWEQGTAPSKGLLQTELEKEVKTLILSACMGFSPPFPLESHLQRQITSQR